MKGPRIGGLPSEENLDLCQKRRHSWTVLLLYLGICVSLPVTIFSAPVREISKESLHRRPNDAGNDAAEGDLPVFEPTAANVSAFVGQTVYLPCRVRNLGDKVQGSSYSHIRRHPVQLGLEVRPSAHAGKRRVDSQARQREKSRLWQVRMPGEHRAQDDVCYSAGRARSRQAGGLRRTAFSADTYKLREHGASSSYNGSSGTEGISGVDDHFEAARGGINVETERGAARTVSELTLAAVTRNDVGKYSCRPTEGRTDTVMLIVEAGERTEAMQRDAGYVSSGCDVNYWPGFLLPFSWFLILARNSQTFLQ